MGRLWPRPRHPLQIRGHFSLRHPGCVDGRRVQPGDSGPRRPDAPGDDRWGRVMVRRLLVLACCALVVSAAAPGAGAAVVRSTGATDPSVARPVDARRPNILLMISDDQAWSDFTPSLMPTVYSQLVDQGVLFKRAYVNTSLCCPSRAQIVTGLYEHHTGVDTNIVPLERPTIVEALHDVGYRTMLAGKYLNSWPCTPRPEFDRWACVGTPTPSTYSMINPVINVDGDVVQLPGLPDRHPGGSAREVRRSPPRQDQPFFAMYSPTTPHMPSDDPRYDSMTITPPRDPSFDDDTIRDSAPLYARRPPLTENEIANADLRYTRMAHGVRSLDDSVATILNGLGDRTRDTLVIYLSDNGFLFGEHRRFGKTDAYEGSVRVPMVIRYPAALPASAALDISRSGLERGHRADAGRARRVPVACGRSIAGPLARRLHEERPFGLAHRTLPGRQRGFRPVLRPVVLRPRDTSGRLLGRGDGARQVRQLRHRRPRAVRPRDGSVRAAQPDRRVRVGRTGCRDGGEAGDAAPSPEPRDDDRDRSLADGSRRPTGLQRSRTSRHRASRRTDAV